MINPSGEWTGEGKNRDVITNRLCDCGGFFFFFFLFFFFVGEVWLS
jgi:hypothetical protein